MRGLRLGVGLSNRIGTPVVITNSANTTVTDTGGKVYTIEKTSGAGGTYNAAAVSAASVAGDFVLRIKLLTASGLFVGLSANPTAAIDAPDLSWQLYTGLGGGRVEESGIAKTAFLAPATYFWIWRSGSAIGYGRGATLALAKASPDWTSTSTATLGLDSEFFDVGEKIEVYLTV